MSLVALPEMLDGCANPERFARMTKKKTTKKTARPKTAAPADPTMPAPSGRIFGEEAIRQAKGLDKPLFTIDTDEKPVAIGLDAARELHAQGGRVFVERE